MLGDTTRNFAAIDRPMDRRVAPTEIELCE